VYEKLSKDYGRKTFEEKHVAFGRKCLCGKCVRVRRKKEIILLMPIFPHLR